MSEIDVLLQIKTGWKDYGTLGTDFRWLVQLLGAVV